VTEDLGFRLEGRRALVTGAGQGLGEGIARLLAAAGVEVLVNDYVPERAGTVAGAIVASGGRAAAVPFDVTDRAGVVAALADVGPVGILVNNAGNAGVEGFGVPAPFVDTGPEDWERFLGVNLHGVLHCTHAVLPGMIGAGWGRVVTIVSDAARTPERGMAVYGAAKAAAAAFGRGIAAEVARHGITVNNVALGTMRTPLTAGLWDDPAHEGRQRAILSRYLVRRPGEPADVAWVVAALVSPRAGWITGQTIPVDGGYTAAL
jgi:2-hydroxycyclohexanecarboxyl-CoA dehydrogenase